MSYYASGYGELKADDIPDKIVDEINEKLPLDVVFAKAWERDGKTIYSLMYEYTDYKEDAIKFLMEKVTPFISDGTIEFTGEDDFWRFNFVDGEWVEETGEVTYTPTTYKQKLGRLSRDVNDMLGPSEPSDEELDYDEDYINLYHDIHNLKESLAKLGY